MNVDQFKDPLRYLCLCGAVVSSLLPMQEIVVSRLTESYSGKNSIRNNVHVYSFFISNYSLDSSSYYLRVKIGFFFTVHD